jgi:hypothetical protein
LEPQVSVGRFSGRFAARRRGHGVAAAGQLVELDVADLLAGVEGVELSTLVCQPLADEFASELFMMTSMGSEGIAVCALVISPTCCSHSR